MGGNLVMTLGVGVVLHISLLARGCQNWRIWSIFAPFWLNQIECDSVLIATREDTRLVRVHSAGCWLRCSWVVWPPFWFVLSHSTPLVPSIWIQHGAVFCIHAVHAYPPPLLAQTCCCPHVATPCFRTVGAFSEPRFLRFQLVRKCGLWTNNPCTDPWPSCIVRQACALCVKRRFLIQRATALCFRQVGGMTCVKQLRVQLWNTTPAQCSCNTTDGQQPL